MKGIILAGGAGSRLWPITKSISKQLLPVYDKPMVYYPLGTLMLAGIQEIAVITTPEDATSFRRLLGDGSQWGISLTYITQKKPNGIGEAFILAEEFIKHSPVALILGDNIFNGSGVGRNLREFANPSGARIFAYRVSNPQDFGVVEIDPLGKIKQLLEKPIDFISDYAIPGLYFYDHEVVNKAKAIERSARGELEITAINQQYLIEGKLEVSILPRGTVWLDGGTVDSLHDASVYVKVIEQRQGLKLCCVEEIAWRNNWIDDNQLRFIAKPLIASSYGDYLLKLIDEGK